MGRHHLTAVLCISLLAGACGVPTEDQGGLPAQPVIENGRQDPEDPDHPIDIRTVRAKVTADEVSVTVIAYEPWGDVAVRPGRGGVLMYLNTTDEGDFNRYLSVEYTKDLRCRLHRANGHALEFVEVERRNARSVTCTLPRDLLTGVSRDSAGRHPRTIRADTGAGTGTTRPTLATTRRREPVARLTPVPPSA